MCSSTPDADPAGAPQRDPRQCTATLAEHPYADDPRVYDAKQLFDVVMAREKISKLPLTS